MNMETLFAPPTRGDRNREMGRPLATFGGSFAVMALVSMALCCVSPAGATESLTSGNWSGPDVRGSDYTMVTARWTQPTVACPTHDARVSIWVGLDNDTIEQAGTIAECSLNSPVVYKAWWEMFYAPDSRGAQPFEVTPGDEIEATVIYANGLFTLAVRDVTSGARFSVQKACSASTTCARNQAEVIVERPGGGKYPLANYGKVEFSSIAATGSRDREILYTMEHQGTVLSTCVVNPPKNGPPKTTTCTWSAAQ